MMTYYDEHQDDDRDIIDVPERPATIDELAEDAMRDELEAEIDATEPPCECDPHGMYEIGSVESIRAGSTDPWCRIHGVEDVRSGAYASWSPAQRLAFDRRLAAGLAHD